MPPLWIAIETSGDQASAAIALPNGQVVEEVVTGSRRHAAELVPALDRILRRAGVGAGRVNGIVVSEGPGSFTGLRIGATVAKGLAHVYRCPLRTASALSVIARRAWRVRMSPRPAPGPQPVRVLAVTDALRGEVYAALYSISENLLEIVRAPAVLSPAELARWPSSDLTATTLPSAATLLDLLDVGGGTIPVHDLETWEPEYGRPAEAQAKWEAAHGRRLPHSSGTPR